MVAFLVLGASLRTLCVRLESGRRRLKRSIPKGELSALSDLDGILSGPCSYTDQLVADQKRLIKCIHVLYEKCAENNISWPGSELERRPISRKCLTHDILKSLGILEPSHDEVGEENPFQDDPAKLLKEMEAKEASEKRKEEDPRQLLGGVSMSRSQSGRSSKSSSRHSGFYPSLGPPPYQYNAPGGNLPPTPPNQSPIKEHFLYGQPWNADHKSMETLNRSAVGMQGFVPRLQLSSPPHFGPVMMAPVNFGQAQTNHHANQSPQIRHRHPPSEQSPSMQLAAQFMQPSFYMTNTGRPANPSPVARMDFIGGQDVTLAQADNSPSLAPLGLQNQAHCQQAVMWPIVEVTSDVYSLGLEADSTDTAFLSAGQGELL